MNIAGSIDWLLEGEDWIRYNTLIQLLDKEIYDPLVQETYRKLIHAPLIMQLFEDIQKWEGSVLKRHNDANHPIHKLSFLAEIEISKDEPAINSCIQSIFAHQSPEGPFQTFSNYPKYFGGSGEDEWVWALCDTPLIVYCLSKFGYAKNATVIRAFSHLSTLVKENGWPCAACESLSKFRGPGKATDPCPYANLLILKAISAAPSNITKSHYEKGIDTLLNLWENSYVQRPFLFKMGTDFRKLKIPFVWYDILHVLDVLSNFPSIHDDKRYQSMLDVVVNKADECFRFTSESVWMKWKGWEFCQKKEPSRWVTFIVLRILKRSGIDIIYPPIAG